MQGYRTIVVFGGSGEGKSTVINTLIGKNEAETGESYESVTKEACKYYHNGFCFVDTPGIGDVKFS